MGTHVTDYGLLGHQKKKQQEDLIAEENCVSIIPSQTEI